MTRTPNARVAGVTFLLYIAIGITQMVVFGGTTAGQGIAAQLMSMAQHAADVRINVALGMLTCVIALTLAVALYAITREQDPDLAMLALVCRAAEGVLGALFIPLTLGLLSVATTAAAKTADAAAAQTLASFVLAARPWNPVVCATFFAVGSTIFCWLLLRGRMVPVVLAWFGVLASALLVVMLPLQLAGLLGDSSGLLGRQLFWVMWFPMLVFELALAVWLIVKGVAAPARAERA
jgi:uncharacterized protein DUF4386